MGRSIDEASSLRRVSPKSAAMFLSEGIPLNMTGASAARYAAECQSILDQASQVTTAETIALKAAKLIVSTASGMTREALDALIVEAADLWDEAAEHGDSIARAYALAAWGFTHSGPEYVSGRIESAEEILECASLYGIASLLPLGYALLFVGRLEQGSIRELDVALLEQRADPASFLLPDYMNPGHWFRCLRSLLDGDLELAELETKRAFAQAPKDGTTTALAIYTSHMGMIRWMRGDMCDAEDGFLTARRDYPEQLLWPASLAWLWSTQGRRVSSETLLRTLPKLEEIPHDRYWLATIVVLAEVARSSGTREHAEKLRAMLLPYAGHAVSVGVGVAFCGTVARTLGLLEEHLGYLDAAREHLELAIDVSARIGALAWQAEAQIELVGFASRHDLEDVPAFELLDEARMICDKRGFSALAARAILQPQIRVLGGFEVVSLCGKKAEWQSRKARELLKMLVATRGVAVSREVFMELLWKGEAPEALTNRFSVAVNAVRRALDPNRVLPTQHHVVTEGDAIRLELEHLDIDLERFLQLAQGDDHRAQFAAKHLYRGEPFSEEPYADWAVDVRDHARSLRKTLG